MGGVDRDEIEMLLARNRWKFDPDRRIGELSSRLVLVSAEVLILAFCVDNG